MQICSVCAVHIACFPTTLLQIHACLASFLHTKTNTLIFVHPSRTCSFTRFAATYLIMGSLFTCAIALCVLVILCLVPPSGEMSQSAGGNNLRGREAWSKSWRYQRDGEEGDNKCSALLRCKSFVPPRWQVTCAQKDHAALPRTGAYKHSRLWSKEHNSYSNA